MKGYFQSTTDTGLSNFSFSVSENNSKNMTKFYSYELTKDVADIKYYTVSQETLDYIADKIKANNIEFVKTAE